MRDMRRRQAMGAIGALALAPFAALALAPAAARGRDLRVPQGSFILERILERGLMDGAAITVARRWSCAFAPTGSGLMVSGGQIFVDVSAPPPLAKLAKLERKRDVTGFLPVALDSMGRISETHADQPCPGLARAIDAALAMIGPADRQDARRFLARLAGAAAQLVSRVPADLFFPLEGDRSERREIALPGGRIGTLEVVTMARAQPETGLLARLDRRVLTRAGDSTRHSLETWRMSPH